MVKGNRMDDDTKDLAKILGEPYDDPSIPRRMIEAIVRGENPEDVAGYLNPSRNDTMRLVAYMLSIANADQEERIIDAINQAVSDSISERRLH